MTNKKIYILLTDTGTLLTRMIRLYTRKTYNHASISFDQKLSEVYSFGRIREENPFIGGFVRENIQNNMFRQANCRIYCCTVSETKIRKMKTYIQKIELEKQRYNYNLLGLFAVMFDMPIKREYAFFCSQFVASVLKEGEVTHFNKPISLITPYDLIKMENLELVYEGKLGHFRENMDALESKPYVISI
ncbi:hypothetical protein [Bacillus niameyensis]|uniref:hypothetical protein n=1 Tax=Bacillus niameyensis TaxID=1522308 RepID=UPI00078147D3|nr:hypothetical protein [Bacillus niameyensis]